LAFICTALPRSETTKSQLRLHLIVFIWGFTAILGDLIGKGAIELVWNRILMALVVLGLYMWWRKISFKTDWRSVGIFVIAGTLIAAHWIAFFHAIKISNVSVTLVCMSSGAFFTSLIEPFFFKRKLYPAEVLLGLVVIAAIALIFSLRTDYLWGIVTALSSAFLAALFSVINGRIARKYPSELITMYELGAGWLAITLLLAFTGSLSLATFPMEKMDWIYLLILGIVCTAYPFIESVRVMRNLSPFTVVLTINMEPVYGIILAYFLLGSKERMSPGFYAGALVIVAVLFANAYLQKRKKLGQGQVE
jgi:drug/metabolite transporter (DMT)-like permease